MLHCKVGVGERLRLDALRRVHDEHRALARGERAGDLIVEVDVAGGVDQVERVLFPVLRGIENLHGAGLDGDAALALEIHVVEQLALHLSRAHGVALFEQAVRQRGLAVVDVRDDGKVADMGLVEHIGTLLNLNKSLRQAARSRSHSVLQRSSVLWNTCATLWPRPG